MPDKVSDTIKNHNSNKEVIKFTVPESVILDTLVDSMGIDRVFASQLLRSYKFRTAVNPESVEIINSFRDSGEIDMVPWLKQQDPGTMKNVLKHTRVAEEKIKKLISEAEKDLDSFTDSLDDLIDVQVSDPITKEDPYMKGLANGLIVARAVATGEEPTFVENSVKHLLSSVHALIESDNLTELAAGDIRILHSVPGRVDVAVLNNVYEYEAPDDIIKKFTSMIQHGAGYNALNFIKKHATSVNKITVDDIHDRAVDAGLDRVAKGISLDQISQEVDSL